MSEANAHRQFPKTDGASASEALGSEPSEAPHAALRATTHAADAPLPDTPPSHGTPHVPASTYLLAPHVALRSWQRVPFACIRRFHARPRALSEKAFRTALACDGKTPLAPSPELHRLLKQGLVLPCQPGAAALTPWQQHCSYNNRVMPWMGLEITARCNYNCIHCFNATSNARLHAQMTLAQVEKLLDEAQGLGMQAVLITGGEPLLHPQFMEIVEAVYAHDLFVFEINTNGAFLTKSLLEKLASFGYKPEMKISFDGLGYHNWMRGNENAENLALRALELCVEQEFPTRVQINVNRKNQSSMLPTLEMLDRMEVSRARIIPTTASTRWEMNAHGQSLGWSEYLQAFLEIARAYAQNEHCMELEGWRVAALFPQRRAFRLTPLRYTQATFKETRPCCAQINGMPAIAANGELYPCLQCSGWFSAQGASFANVFEEGLAGALRSEAYCQIAHATVAEKRAHQQKMSGYGPARTCDACPWLTHCAGGCPALGGLAHNGDMLMPDPCACTFFFDGWPQRYVTALSSWRCLNDI